MQTIALTGGIGSGKSTVAAMFAELGAHTVDADQLAREAVAVGTPALAQLVTHFGAGILDAQGNLLRQKLGERVFQNPEKRRLLESIVHPHVQRLFTQKQQEVAARDPRGVLIYEIPLLVESGQAANFAAVITVSADAQTRLARLVANRGLTPAAASARIEAQVSDAEREAVADWVVHTDVPLAQTRAQVQKIWIEINRSKSF